MELDYNAMSNIEIMECMSVLSPSAWIENDVLPGGDRCYDCSDRDDN